MTEPTARPRAAPPPEGWRARIGAAVPTPTPLLASLVAASAVLAVLVPWLWVPVAVVALAAAGVDAARCVDPWTVRVAREHDTVVVLDRRAELAWHVVNPSERSVHVTVADAVVPSLGLAGAVATLDLPALTAGTARTTFQPSRRGRLSPDRLTVRVRGPWGLVTRQHTRSLVTRLDVHPTFRSRHEAELRITRGRILEAGIRSARAMGRGTEFEQLREYTPDDEFRRIDWGATARAGTPIVRTYRAERNQTVQVLLDTGRTMAGLVEGVPRLDHAMDAVLALGTVATRLGDRIGLLAYSSGIRGEVPADGRGRQVTAFAEAMFGLEADLTESDHELAVTHAVTRHRRRSLLVLLTELAGESLAETLVPSLPLLLRHHVVMVGAVRDPEVERWRTAVPAAPDAAYRAAGAVTVTRARDRTAGLLRRMGAVVIDAGPTELASRLADAYLDVKSTGRL